MFRIDDPSAATSMPTPEAAGTEGFWTEGNPSAGVAATLERASWFNMMQEEMRAVVVAGGQTPSKTVFNQLLTALQAMYGPGRVGHSYTVNDWAPLLGGLILQWGGVSTDSSGNATLTYPTAFTVGSFVVLAIPANNAGNTSVSVYGGTATQVSIKSTTNGAAASTTINYLALGK